MAIFTRPVQNEADRNPNMERVGRHKAQPLSNEIPVLDTC